MSFQELSRWIQAHQEEMVQLQAELTARPAMSPETGGVGEWQKARFLEAYLRRHGLEQIEHYDCPDERVPEKTRPNFAVILPGGRQSPCVWVVSHLDVVPPGEKLPDGSWAGWDGDPFQLRRLGQTIVGRGVTDNQQSIVSSIFAARALVECGAKPAHNVRLLFVSDEETHSKYGLWHVLEAHKNLFSPQDAIIVPDAGSEDSTMIEVAEKSLLWLEFMVRGRQAHASRPDKAINAFRAAAQLVCRLDEALRERFNRLDMLFETPTSTFEPTLREPNVPNVNTIPGQDVFCFDCRVLPGYELDDVIECAVATCRQVDARMKTVTEVRVRARQDAPPPTSPEAPVVRLLKLAIQEVYGVTPVAMGIGGLTVAALFRKMGLPAAVWMTTTGSAHQVNESCAIPHMVGDACVFARIFVSEF